MKFRSSICRLFIRSLFKRRSKCKQTKKRVRDEGSAASLHAVRCPVDKLSASDADDKFAKANRRDR